MSKNELMGDSHATITKSTMVIKKASNTDIPVDTSTLGSDEAIYTFMESGDFTVFTTSVGKLKVEKTSKVTYNIYENYVDGNSAATKTMIVGESSSMGTFTYVVGNVSGQVTSSVSAGPAVPICFPAGTLVETNKGEVAIEMLNPDVHKIRGKRIVAITETSPKFKYIIRIEKDALVPNVPSRRTEISRDHEILYKGKMIRSEDLVDKCEGVYRIKYHGETLYNVLMEKHDKMMINNLICETLHPNNIMAKICSGEYTTAEKNKIYKELNDALMNNDLNACKKMYDSL